MNQHEALAMLTEYQKWRRANDDEFPMPHPKQIGIAIDVAIQTLTEVCRHA